MTQVAVYNLEGAQVGEIELNDNIFNRQVNVPVMHQAATLFLASQRRGTHATKTRAMVSGGGRKPWKQKGTGRARAGSSRSPIWRAGGITFGPSPRKYGFTMPRKLRRVALASALSDKVQNGNLIVLDSLAMEAPKTKTMAGLLDKFDTRSALVVVPCGCCENAVKSARNIEKALPVEVTSMNTYYVLAHEKLFIAKDALSWLEGVLG